jgi:AcrR family transcriptional regulator
MSDRSSITHRTEPATDRRRARHDLKKARILEEAWDLAARDGLAGISLRDLADRVDLRQPSLYAYFDSKLALYDEMFADGYRKLLARVAAAPPMPDPREELVAFLELCVRFSSDEPVCHQLLFQRTIPGFEPSEASFAVALEFYEVASERMRAAGVTDDADIDVFTAIVNGLAHQQVANDPGGDRWVRLSRRMVEMFLADVDRRGAKPARRSGRPTPNRRGERPGGSRT